MTPKKVTPEELKAQKSGPVSTVVHDLDSCPTCLSGIEASTLETQYLDILKR